MNTPLAPLHPLLCWSLLCLWASGIGTACQPSHDTSADQNSPPDAVEESPGDDLGAVDEATFEAARNEAFRLVDAHSDLHAARDALLRAHAMRPQAFGVNRRLGAIDAELRLNVPAVEHYRAALDAHPDDNSVRQSLVALLAMLERGDEMLAELPILRADPDHAGEALFLEARLRDMRGDRQAAESLLAEADELPQGEAYRALSLHGRFVFQGGDHTRAQGLFSRAHDGRPDYKEAIKGLADCARRLGQNNQAEHWSTILSLLLELTDNEYIKKNDTLRQERLEELLELMPEYTNGFKLLADIYRRTHQGKKACAVIERFIALHGELLSEEDTIGLRGRYCRDKNEIGS